MTASHKIWPFAVTETQHQRVQALDGLSATAELVLSAATLYIVGSADTHFFEI